MSESYTVSAAGGIADRDHILFNFTERQRSEDVVTLSKGCGGHIQADACRVYNALFRPSDPDAPDDEHLPTEVGCWAHARRKFFEAAFAKLAMGREGLLLGPASPDGREAFKLGDWFDVLRHAHRVALSLGCSPRPGPAPGVARS